MPSTMMKHVRKKTTILLCRYRPTIHLDQHFPLYFPGLHEIYRISTCEITSKVGNKTHRCQTCHLPTPKWDRIYNHGISQGLWSAFSSGCRSVWVVETPWVSTCKDRILWWFDSPKKSWSHFCGGFPSKKASMLFFSMLHVFYLEFRGKYVKLYLILYVYSTDSCWPPNAGSLWLTHRLWTRISATGRSKNPSKV